VGILVVSLGIVTVTSAPASATCSNHATPTNKDPGTEFVTGAGSTGVARRLGPHTSCILLSRIPNNRQLDMWCWDYGDNINGVNTWSWVRYRSHQLLRLGVRLLPDQPRSPVPLLRPDRPKDPAGTEG
jgi:hypothetical protein